MNIFVILKKHSCILLLIILLLPFFIKGQDTLTNKEIRKKQKNFLIQDRPWTVELPLWIPGFAGEFAYGDIEIEGEDGEDIENPIEPPPGGPDPPGCEIGNIFSRLFTKNWYLKFFFLTRIAYEKNKFITQIDALAGGVGNSVDFNYNNKKIVEASFRTINVRLFAGYKFIDKHSANRKFKYELFGYLGTRAHFQRIYSELDDDIINLDVNPYWFEPIIGLQNQFTWKRWFLVLMGDYGGYFVGTKHSYQASTFVYYKSGKVISLKAGWNHLRLNHEGAYRGDDLKVNMTLSGPMIGIAFQF